MLIDDGEPGNFAQHILFHAYKRYGDVASEEVQLAIASACGKLLACLSEDGAVDQRLLVNALLRAMRTRGEASEFLRSMEAAARTATR
jgi:hypothetical protein